MARQPSPFRLLRNPIGFFREIELENGRVAEMPLGGRRFYLVHEPEIIQDFLITQSAKFVKFPQVNPDHGLFGKGLLTSEEPLHLRQRRLMQPAFHRERLQQYGAEMAASANRSMDGWRAGAVVDIAHGMNRLALDIVTRTLFANDRAPEVEREIDIVLHALNRLVMPWGDLWVRLPLPSSRRYRRALGRLDAIVAEFLKDRRQGGDGLLDMLAASRDAETGGAMSDAQIRDEVMTIFVAGHDTTANALTWTLYLLAKHPEVQARVAGWVREVLRGRDPGFDDLPQLTAVEHVFAESLRLYPPVWILGRRALEPYSFSDFQAAPGSILLVCMAVLHRNEAFFDRADEFLPTRWLAPCWPRYAFLPFGAGVRTCIGERFAWMEGVLCLAALMQRFRFELVDAVPPVPLGLLTLRPKLGMRLRVCR